MITKNSIVQGAFDLMRINGLTVKASPESVSLAVQVLDDYMAEIAPQLDLGYIQPSSYGESTPSDYSGLTANMVGPAKKLLSVQLLLYYGKPLTPALITIADNAMRSLEHQAVTVLDAKNPPTLPIGSGNEWDYRSDKFYPDPTTDNNPENHYRDDVFNLTIDWKPFLDSSVLTTIEYDNDPAIALSNQTIVDDRKSSVMITFNRLGQYTLCVTATNDMTGEKLTKKFIYNSIACRDVTLYP